MLAKKHPTFKDEILTAFRTSDFDLKDISSFKELDKAFEEIIKLADKKDADPKSIRAKWKQKMDKFFSETNVKKADAVDKYLKVGVAIAIFIPKLLSTKNTFEDIKKKNKDEEAILIHKLGQRNMPDGSTVLDNTLGITELKLQMTALLEKHFCKS